MSSGLTAAKCPSCKIILLRPVHYLSSSGSSSSSARSSARSSSAAMHCTACRKQYSLRKGTIIPAIVLASATLPSGIQTKINMDGSASAASWSPVHKYSAVTLVSDTAALTLSPLRLQPPRNQPIIRSSSFTKESAPSPTRYKY